MFTTTLICDVIFFSCMIAHGYSFLIREKKFKVLSLSTDFENAQRLHEKIIETTKLS